MFHYALSPRKRFAAVVAAALLPLACAQTWSQPDPPAQAGRLSYVTGNVSIQPAGSDDWGLALPNLPIGPGDRVFTDSDGRAEIQVGQTFVRIGPNADVSLVDSSPEGITFGVAQGSIHLRTSGLWDGQSVYVNTPSGSSTLSYPGEQRVDVLPDEQSAVFTAYGSNLFIAGAGGFQQQISDGQSLQLIGSNPVYPQWLQAADWDQLDNWSRQRDEQIAMSQSYRYVSREVPGAYELDAAGTWEPGTPYGPVWFPNSVQAGWAPYHNGHWVNHAPWGWVWVEDEPWGYAPFHYGRWVSFNGRWGWVPGPPAAHPVWSPALVVFAGGVNFGGGALSVWFPLGPGEPYHPWYPCSPRYVDRVNITNITPTAVVHVQTTYVNINVTNVTYVNRTIGVTAMNTNDFSAGRPVRQSAVAVNPQMLQHIQPVTAPLPQPARQAMIAGPPPARPVRVAAARPMFINQTGKAITAIPNARPVEPPVRPAPQIKPPVGHAVVNPPANAVKVPMPPARGVPPPIPPRGPAGSPPANEPHGVPAPNGTPRPPEPHGVPAPDGTPRPQPPLPAQHAAPVPPPPPPPKANPPAPEERRPAPEVVPPPKPRQEPPPPPRVNPPAPEERRPAPEVVPPPKPKQEPPPPPKPDNNKEKNKKDDKDKKEHPNA